MIELDIAKRHIHFEVTEEDLIKKKQARQRPEPDFLSGKSGADLSSDSH